MLGNFTIYGIPETHAWYRDCFLRHRGSWGRCRNHVTTVPQKTPYVPSVRDKLPKHSLSNFKKDLYKLIKNLFKLQSQTSQFLWPRRYKKLPKEKKYFRTWCSFKCRNDLAFVLVSITSVHHHHYYHHPYSAEKSHIIL